MSKDEYRKERERQEDYDFLRERVRTLNIERNRLKRDIQQLQGTVRALWEYHFDSDKEFRTWYWKQATKGKLPEWLQPRTLRE
tara:strand:+ start:574 stop:822 length:249 start_codon:yes stop_codon:yes gene_type:complete